MGPIFFAEKFANVKKMLYLCTGFETESINPDLLTMKIFAL